jgi:hypothetical protein
MFTISKQIFKKVIISIVQKEMDCKLKILNDMPFFDVLFLVNRQQIDNMLPLIPLASHIKIQKFNLGDIVFRENSSPNYFYVIAKGRVKLVKEEMVVRQKKLFTNKPH